MTTAHIKLVVPGGEPYQGALVEGVAKVAARRGLSGPAASELAQLVTIGASAINSTEPTSIELTIDAYEAHIAVTLSGRGSTSKSDDAAVTAFATQAESGALSHKIEQSRPEIRFDVATQ